MAQDMHMTMSAALDSGRRAATEALIALGSGDKTLERVQLSFFPQPRPSIVSRL